MNNVTNMPYITLMAIQTLNGKVNTGLEEYPDLEDTMSNDKTLVKGSIEVYNYMQERDDWLFISAETAVQLHANSEDMLSPADTKKSRIVYDNSSMLTVTGMRHITEYSKDTILVTHNDRFGHSCAKIAGLKIYYVNKTNSMKHMFETLYEQYGIKKILLRTPGTINAKLLKYNLIDSINLAILPVFISNSSARTACDSAEVETFYDFLNKTHFKIKDTKIFKDNIVMLKYDKE